ncbi:TIGR01777 family protein [Adhaeribacter swui]|uniref:TIGR01777 family protein n=1 Tax=Adhaeribacter swui TaxID=2086471 RepID=A0A7G7G2R9_9BACT|nr:TIGR01777 family oxidoreductase [Adhaeribacter swui]QNF31453.1 TIGR01777 family protein [Adhaeribacter swui]
MAGKILITGGTGLIGTRLSEMLIDLGYEVAHLSRNGVKHSRYQTFKWDIAKNYIEEKALTYTDYIINLAGAGVADEKWTEKRKQEIRDSRVNGTNLLINQLQKTSHHVKGFISASAVGIYGNSGERLVAEESSYAENDFLANVCREWEAAANQANNLGIRTAIFRIGIVLSKEGGALPQLAKPIKLLVGAPLGSGQQYISWIHLDDMCRLLIAALEDHQFQGVYNAVAPHPVTNEEFTQKLAEVLHKPLTGLKVPAFGLKLVLGEMSETVLGGTRVSANRVLQTGFTYEYNYLEEALESFYAKEV